MLIEMATQACGVVGWRCCRHGCDDGRALRNWFRGVTELEQATPDEVYQERQQHQKAQPRIR